MAVNLDPLKTIFKSTHSSVGVQRKLFSHDNNWTKCFGFILAQICFYWCKMATHATKNNFSIGSTWHNGLVLGNELMAYTHVRTSTCMRALTEFAWSFVTMLMFQQHRNVTTQYHDHGTHMGARVPRETQPGEPRTQLRASSFQCRKWWRQNHWRWRHSGVDNRKSPQDKDNDETRVLWRGFTW